MVGGFIGENQASVTNAYSSGLVTGTSNVGGFAGINTGGIIDCFWDNETSGIPIGTLGTPRTTAQMMQQATFDPPWNFATIWGIEEYNSYPYLLAIETAPIISVDVGITIADSADPIMTGDTFNYSFEVTNNGPDNALDVQVIINLPWYNSSEILEVSPAN